MRRVDLARAALGTALTLAPHRSLEIATGRGPSSETVTGLSRVRREILITGTLDAEPDHRDVLPDPTGWPLLLAIASGVGFIGAIFTPWGILWGAALAAVALIGWFWPRNDLDRTLFEEQPAPSRPPGTVLEERA